MAKPARHYKYPFQNPDLPVEERIDDLLSRMTLEEKIHFLGSSAKCPRLGLHGINHVEGLHGLALGGPGNWGRPTPIPTTTFCQAIGLGETWDPDAVKQVAEVEAEEVRYCYQSPKYQRGGLVVRAPNADIGRDIRWGRTEECYGEDAWFNGMMTVAFVKGLQGDHPRYWKTAALMKHFCANSNEDTRDHSSSDFDARLFHEYYALPFRMGVMEGGSRAYMAAYNCVNGIPCTVHPMLKDITVKQWGQDGIICTDGGALRLLISAHKYYPTLAQGAAWAVKMGISQFLDRHTEPTQEAIAKDFLTEADIDASLRGNFRVMIKLGILDPEEMVPYRKIGTDGTPEPWTTEKNKQLAREVTRKSIVLLKNRGDLLPLDRKSLKSIAVVGLHADRVFLDWYSGTPPYTVSPLDGIRAKAGPDISVSYAPDNTNEAAVEFAKAADVAIVIVGNHPTCNAGWARTVLSSDGKEAVDRKSITLEHEELVKQVAKANPRTVVVLVSSFPYAINWTQQNVPAIVHMTHNSQETGNALADVLFGDYNPAGRIVQTWPKSIDQLPELMQYNIRNGRTYMYFKGEPLYPFGFGLSYTTFAYANLRPGAKKLSADGTLTLELDVTNTGGRDGEEVVQVYAKYLASAVERPNRQLVAFKRIAIRKRQTKTVQLKFAASQLAYWENAKKAFVVEPGRLQLMVGASSADIRQTAEVDLG